MRKIIFIIFLIVNVNLLKSQTIFSAIENYDTLFVRNYIVSGGDVDALEVQKWRISKSKRRKTSVTIYERCIGAIRESKDEITYDNTIKAYKNLDLFLNVIDRSKNKQKNLDRLFNLSMSLGDVELSRKIQSLGTDLNTRCMLCYGRTAILIALGYNENIEMLKFLLSLKPDLTVKDFDGKGFLHYASQVNNLEMVKYYIDNRLGDINEVDKLHHTALDYAAANGNYQMFNYLISKGAKYDIVSPKGHTVLHSAASSGNPEFFKHVHYVTGLPLWYEKRSKIDVIHFAGRLTKEQESIYLYIVRYTIEKYGMKYYKKRKRAQFMKNILT